MVLPLIGNEQIIELAGVHLEDGDESLRIEEVAAGDEMKLVIVLDQIGILNDVLAVLDRVVIARRRRAREVTDEKPWTRRREAREKGIVEGIRIFDVYGRADLIAEDANRERDDERLPLREHLARGIDLI
jgi:hypothetical protein